MPPVLQNPQAPRLAPSRPSGLASRFGFLCLVSFIFILVLTVRLLAHDDERLSSIARLELLEAMAANMSCPTEVHTVEKPVVVERVVEKVVYRTTAARPRRRDPRDLPRELYHAVHADPSLLDHASVAEAFLPTPWLLPGVGATKERLPYLRLHNDLGALLEARSARFGGKANTKAVSVVYFGHSQSVMLQNWVYSAVKWAGITNYIVATWEDKSLAACLAMHLPCLNASTHLPLPLAGDREAPERSKDAVPLSWLRPLLTSDIVSRGYHVHSSDVSVAFPPKDFWASMLNFLEPSNSDVAMERDLWGPVNTGSMVVRPTFYSMTWLGKWVADAVGDAKKGVDDQERVMQLGELAFRTCDGPWDCKRMTQLRDKERKESLESGEKGAEKGAPAWAIVRRYLGGFDALYQDRCAGAHLEWTEPIDPCLPTATNYQLTCITGSDSKVRGFKATGLWFLDDDGTQSCMKPPPGEAEVDAAAAAEFAAKFVKEAEGGSGQETGSAAAAAANTAGSAGGDEAAGGEDVQGGAAGAGSEEDGGEGVARRRLGGKRQVLADAGEAANTEAAAAAAAAAAEIAKKGVRAAVSGSSGSKSAAGASKAELVARCRPLQWRQPGHEDAFVRCDRSQLAYKHYFGADE